MSGARVEEIAPGVWMIMLVDRTTKRFENLWPLPKGVTYNSYVIRTDEGAILLDAGPGHMKKEFMEVLRSVTNPNEIRYVITHHTEPDHSALIPDVLGLSPEAIVLGTRMALEIGSTLVGLPRARAREASHGEVLELGGRRLKFIHAPLVHWPDTMITHLEDEGITFTCDLFGSFGIGDSIFYEDSRDQYELIDYYVSVLATYSMKVAEAIEEVRALGPKLIAPSHGGIHRNVEELLDLYKGWAEWRPGRKALVVVGSQYGYTEMAARYAAKGLEEAGLEVEVIDSAEMELDDVLAKTLESSAIVIATSTHNAKPFFGITVYLELLAEVRPKNRLFSIIASFSWGGVVAKIVRSRIEAMGLRVYEVMGFRGRPSESDLERARELGRRLGLEVRSLAG